MERENILGPDREPGEIDQDPREESDSEEAVTGGDVEREDQPDKAARRS